MTIRKNFNFKEETVRQLEELAKLNEKTQTQMVQEAIDEMYKTISIKRKLAILDEINDSFHGLLTNVDAKASRMEHAMEKYGKDTNIFIDLLDSTRPFYKGSFSLVKSSVADGKRLYLNSDSITNAFYILNRTHDTATLIALMQKMISLFIVVPIENEEVVRALALCADEACAFRDYEDALQYVCAKKVGADLIVTNDNGFVALDIELLRTKS